MHQAQTARKDFFKDFSRTARFSFLVNLRPNIAHLGVFSHVRHMFIVHNSIMKYAQNFTKL